MPKSYCDLSETEHDALRIAARGLSVRLPDTTVSLESASWQDLHALRSATMKVAKGLLNQLSDANAKTTSADDIRRAEERHDNCMAIIDGVQEQIEARDAHGQREPLSASQRGIPDQSGQAWGADDGTRGFGSMGSSWSTKEGDEIRVLSPGDRFAERSDWRGPSLGTILRSMITGPRNDAERRALAEGTDSAGGYTVPTPLADQFIDKLRSASVCVRAGARTVPMTSKTLQMARLETDPTVAWRAENAQIGASDPTFGAVTFDAKSLMGLVVVSRELMDDSVNAAAMLENAFVQATALKFDQGLLFGSGSSNEPTGLSNAGITSVSMGTNGAALADYDKIIDTIYQIQLANGGDPNAMIYHPRTGAALAKLKDGNNNPLTVPEMVAKVAKYPTTSVSIAQTQGSSSVASTILVGDFTRMMIGLRNQLTIAVLKERYADYNQLGFVFGMRGDVQFEHVASFSKLVGVL